MVPLMDPFGVNSSRGSQALICGAFTVAGLCPRRVLLPLSLSICSPAHILLPERSPGTTLMGLFRV